MYSFFSCFFLLSLLIFSPCIHAGLMPQIFTVNSKKNSSITWREFKKFRYASKGNHVNGISELKKYLNRFGYLEAEDILNSTDLFDEDLENAITRYQKRLGLPINGKLDSRTLSQLVSPRCGVSDTSSKTLRSTKRYAYFTGHPRWRRSIPMTLTYALSPTNTITTLSMQDVRAAFQRAFRHWASVIPVTFVESNDYGFADIKIGFYVGDHGDGEAFDGILGVLAHAFFPESGRFHLDAAETWAVDFSSEKSNVAVDLESVATHEIGHLLGLAHSDVKESVMYPSLKPRQKKVDLKVDDIKGVQALYGLNPNFSFQAFSESDISSNDAVDLWLFREKLVWLNFLVMFINFMVVHVMT